MGCLFRLSLVNKVGLKSNTLVQAEIVSRRWPKCGRHCWLTVANGGYLSEEEEAMRVEGKEEEEEEGEEGMFNFILFIRAFWTFHV